MDPDVNSIANIIQLAITPVFLLVGIGSVLNVVTGRLARITDRVRALETDVLVAEEGRRREEIEELSVLARRMQICHWAVAMCTVSAILVCVLVSVLFVASIAAIDFSVSVAALFVAAMVALTGGLLLFFAEVSISTRVVRVREEYAKARKRPRDAHD